MPPRAKSKWDQAAGKASAAKVAAKGASAPAGNMMSRAGQFAADHYWTIDSILGKINALVDSFTHVISVKVVGGPAADLRRCYYLACAAAFGRFSRATTRVQGSYFEMSCSTDVTDKSVTITLGYNTGLMGDIARATLLNKARTPLDVMFDGPDQVTVGRGWTAPFFTARGAGSRYAGVTPDTRISGGGVKTIAVTTPYDVPDGITLGGGTTSIRIDLARNVWQVDQPEVLRLPRVPVAVFRPFALEAAETDVLRELPTEPATSDRRRIFYLRRVVPKTHTPYTVVATNATARVPVLPDDGRLITTGETRDFRVQPPRPPVDGIARGSLLAMTIQALTEPGFLPQLPRLTTVPLATGGYYLNAPGTTVDGAAPGDQRGAVRAQTPPPVVKLRIRLPITGTIVTLDGAPAAPQRPDAPLLRDPRTVRPALPLR